MSFVDLYKFSDVSGLLFSIRVQVCRGRDNIVLQIGSNALNGSDRTCEEIDSATYSRERSTKLRAVVSSARFNKKQTTEVSIHVASFPFLTQRMITVTSTIACILNYFA